MSSAGHLSELESLRSEVAELSRKLAERDQSMQDLREQSDLLKAIVEGTATDTGEDFFRSLTRHLARALNVRYAFVGEWRPEIPDSVRTLAVWSGTDFVEPFEYDLRNTPCANVVGQQFCLHESGVQCLFPEDHFLVQLEVESYCGMPLFDKSGNPLGLLVVMDSRPITCVPLVKDLLQIFAVRAAAALQRQQVNETLRESERRLRFTQCAVDHAEDGVLWADDSKRFRYANEAACRLLGYSNEELLTLSISDIAPYHDPTWFQQGIDQFKQGTAATYESIHRRKDGTEFPVEASVIYLEHEGRGYICGIVRDITERKRIEHERLQALHDLQNIMETAPDIMFTLDIQGNMVSWNRRVRDVTGYSPEELLNKPALAFVPLEERACTAAAIQRAFTDGYAELDGHLLTKEHRLISYHWTGALLKNPHGEPIGITGIGRDVSDRKRAEEELKQERRQLVDAQALAHLGSWAWDVDTGEVEWSDEQFRIFGYEPGAIAITHDTFLASLHPDDHDPVLAAINDSLLGNRPCDVEYRIVRPNGEIRSIHARGEVHRNAIGHPLSMAGTVLDITERKQAEEAVQRSERRYAMLLGNLNGMVYRCRNDKDWTMDYVSEGCLALVGYPAEDLLGNMKIAFGDLVHPDDRDWLWEKCAAHLQDHRPCSNEYRILTAGGTVKWVWDQAQGIYSDTGELLTIEGFTTDITERKRVEEALRESEERLRLSLEAANQGIYDLNVQTGEALVSSGYVTMLDYDPATFRETNAAWIERLHPDDRERVADYYRAYVAGEIPEYRVEFRQRTRGGGWRWILSLGRIVERDARGEPLRMLGTHTDITERKWAEEAIREAELRYRTIFEQAGAGVAQIESRTGRFVQVNRQYCEILGLTEAEILATTVGAVTYPDDLERDLESMTHLLSGGIPSFTMEKRYLRKDGSIVWVNLNVAPLWQSGEMPVHHIAIVQDITERKQLAEREASRVRQLKKLYELSMTLSGDPGVVFEHVVRAIGELFEVQVVCLSEIVGRELYFKSVYVNGQTFMDAGHCSLEITPCATVEQTKELRTFDRVMERFPQASFLRDHQAVSYCGFPALDNEGRVVAVTCLLDDKPHEFSQEEQDLLRIIGQRIATEIERSRHAVEQKRAADELRHSHTFIRQIIDADPNFIFVKDRDGRFTLANKAVADAYGTTVDFLVGKLDSDFNANPNEVEYFSLKDLEVMDSLQEQFIPEEAITDSMGRMRWLQTVKRPILDETGRAIMVFGSSTDITERKRIEEVLRQRERDLRIAVEERERISQDLHDGILQSLFAVGLGLEASKLTMSPRIRKTSGPPLDQAIDQLNRVMQEIRNFIAGLGSELLQGKNLPAALQHMLKSLTQNQATRVRLAVEDRAAQAVSAKQALHLFLVIQEAVSNCIRHGRAPEARVSLKMLKQGVRLSIRDNGRGFNPKAAKGTGHGLGNMAARAQKIGGRFTIVSKVNEGTRIVLDLPKEASVGCR